jgi:hypothetical protein
VLWTTLPAFTDPQSARFDGLAVAADGTLYASGVGFNTAADSLVALDDTGKVFWNTSLRYGSPAIGNDGTLYACAGAFGSLVAAAFSPSGSVIWKGTAPESTSQCAPVILADSTVVFPSTNNLKTSLVGYAPDGSVRWTFAGPALLDTFAYGFTSPIAVGPDGSLYAFDNEQASSGQVTELVAVSPAHAVAWKAKYSSLTTQVAAGPDGHVYVSTFEALYAYDGSGKQLWSMPASGNTFIGVALRADGTLYAGIEGQSPTIGSMVALSAADGTQKWQHPGDCFDTRPLVGADGTVYAGSIDHLCAYGSSGDLRWSVPVLTNGDSIADIALGAGGTIAVATHASGLLLVGD